MAGQTAYEIVEVAPKKLSRSGKAMLCHVWIDYLDGDLWVPISVFSAAEEDIQEGQPRHEVYVKAWWARQAAEELANQKPDDEEFEDAVGLRKTPRALVVRIGKDPTEYMIPDSQIRDSSEVKDDGDRGTLVISRWIAEQKGLVGGGQTNLPLGGPSLQDNIRRDNAQRFQPSAAPQDAPDEENIPRSNVLHFPYGGLEGADDIHKPLPDPDDDIPF